MTIIEAMAVGKPVIASEIGGIPELVGHGATGLLVPPGDVERLRDAIQSLHGNPALRREMGRAARRRAEGDHSLPVHLDRVGALYEEVLANQES